MNVSIRQLKVQLLCAGVLVTNFVLFQDGASVVLAKNESLSKASGSGDKSKNTAQHSKAMGGVGVDWSSWASKLADRWYEKLITLEKQSGRHFHTRRPARIKFTCYPDGTIGQISVFRSCGVPAYDRMQIEALKQTVPLPAFPAGSRRKSFTLLQGWESHPRVPGESEFTPGSYGKNFPLERLKPKHKKS